MLRLGLKALNSDGMISIFYDLSLAFECDLWLVVKSTFVDDPSDMAPFIRSLTLLNLAADEKMA